MKTVRLSIAIICHGVYGLVVGLGLGS